MKTLKIIFVVLVLLGGLAYFVIWYSFRTTSENVSHLKPFSEIIGKELTTKQTSFIALNAKNWVKENPYIVTMKRNKLSGNVTKLQVIPIGSIMRITDAKRYTNGVTGFKSTFILGSIFLKKEEEKVQFEFAWGEKKYDTDLPGDHFIYRLAPWQEKPLETMYNYEKNIEIPLENYNNVTELK